MNATISIDPAGVNDGRGPAGAPVPGPIDPFSQYVERPATAVVLVRATWAFVALGIVLRVVRYLSNYPLWHDEAFVAVNFLDRGYLDMLRPLNYGQVCPLLFLWIELAAVRLLGFSEWSLRLFPTLCSVGSVLLFRHVAARVLGGATLVMAVAIFAVSFYPIRHGAEVKPYACDLLAALVLLAVTVEWWRAPGRVRWLWGLSGVVPLALGLSYPAVFVAGGISLALGVATCTSRRRDLWLPYVALNAVLAGSFLVFYFASISAQSAAVLARYRWGYWVESFPPLGEPLALLRWLVSMHTGNMFAYPIGGERGGSTLTLACVVTASIALWRRGRRTLLALCLAPACVALFAAAIGRYPYGGEARIMQYLAPAICLLAGLGAADLLCRMGRPRGRIVLLALAAWGFALVVRDVVHPYRTLADVRARAFARWFWNEKSADAELVCTRTDLGVDFGSDQWRVGLTSVYLCNQRIQSPRHRERRPPRLDTVSGARPLRCVLYNVPHYGLPRDQPAYAGWLARMATRYDLCKCETYVVNSGAHLESWQVDRYIVHEFLPRADGPAARLAVEDRETRGRW